ncbi:hypothetical protein K402DRAFT_187788 [Aulographum hederae CBS 113979]|uniref:Uncharacterized protein n=1 Tax=Aulographum hederae CBS 113979 TaxID=1176131 RepID=A0A6G1GPK2_9PEZI|nr:hypothetical protein K402DRAFT_187788 [Aulographum hederae CBS 113979]
MMHRIGVRHSGLPRSSRLHNGDIPPFTASGLVCVAGPETPGIFSSVSWTVIQGDMTIAADTKGFFWIGPLQIS